MNVVRGKLIKDKISEEISKTESVYGKIERIELNRKEFEDFVNQVEAWGRVRLNRSAVCPDSEKAISGDFLMWRGVRIQHHSSYE